jgi:hypothetical protein
MKLQRPVRLVIDALDDLPEATQQVLRRVVADARAAARDQYTALLPTIEEVLGPRHPDTLTARANLAHWTALASESEATGGSISNPAAPRRRRR